MPALTKMRPIKKAKYATKKSEVTHTMSSFGRKKFNVTNLNAEENFSKSLSKSESASWRETLKDTIAIGGEAATVLRGARLKAEMTQVELAKELGIEQGNLSAMETGKRTIGRQMAKRLAAILDIDYRVFL